VRLVAKGNGWLKEHVGVVAAAVIAGVFGLVTAIITPGGNESTDQVSTTTSQTSEHIPTSPPSTTSSESTVCNEPFQITKPADGTKISASGGVILEGTACETDLIWILDYDPTDGSYFQVNNEPLHVLRGQWIQVDKPIGDPADEVGTVYTIIVMKVSPACSDQLKTAEPDEDGTVWFNPMPQGCPSIEDKINTRTVQVVNAGP
jgi:hypothetical protein